MYSCSLYFIRQNYYMQKTINRKMRIELLISLTFLSRVLQFNKIISNWRTCARDHGSRVDNTVTSKENGQIIS